MKTIAFAVIAVLSFSILGCKPDAAVERGSVIGAGPATSEKDVKKAGAPVITEPKTDKQYPVKEVK